MIISTIEIDRPQAEVFAYLNELDRHPEWQEDLISSKIVSEGPVGLGARATDKRKVPGGPREMTYEVTQYDPPRKSSWQVLDGPVRSTGSVSVEPIGDGSRSRVTLELDLNGHGLRLLIAPFARRQAARQVPKSQAKLKEVLERRVEPGSADGGGVSSPQ